MSYASTPNFKVLLIGNSSVGKSSLLLRFTDDDFLSEEETTATIGVDFRTKAVEVDGQRYKLSIWDTAGQERFRTLTSSYYRGAQAVVLGKSTLSVPVYDVTARETFDELLRWLKEIDTYCAEGVVKCLVGNKIDRGFSRQVTEAEGLELAGRLGTLFVECSAKTRENVTNVFEELVREVLNRPQLYSNDVNLRKSDQAFKLGGRGAAGGEDELEDGAAGWVPGCSC